MPIRHLAATNITFFTFAWLFPSAEPANSALRKIDKTATSSPPAAYKTHITRLARRHLRQAIERLVIAVDDKPEIEGRFSTPSTS